MGRISLSDGYYTLVNMFRVRAEDQQRMYDEIVDVTDVIRRFPGFVSANVHLSEDGIRVVNYAQWRSKEEFEAMQRHPSVQDHFRRCRELAEIDSVFCELAYTHDGT
ncbi:antibiotic biosynthesis monooxygenase family protein [Streptomyces sp. NPDC001668]|uniref:antibiotic biosynthesis monooxygenase family protein n=1 Tax=unclassified Streptomyces TaxID=2593676 RepID=UPI0033E19EBF